jgi:Domain of unknown function (DUF4349)
MKLREHEMPLDPEIERELEAIDRALAGQPVDPNLEELALLAPEIRSERPQPSAEAETHLDDLAASEFPARRSDRLGRLSRRVSDAFEGLRRVGMRRVIPAFGAAAVFLAAAAIGISASGVFESGQDGAGSLSEPGGGLATSGKDSSARSANNPAAANQYTPPDVSATGSYGQAHRFSRSGAPPVAELAGPSNRRLARDVDLDLSTAPDDFRDAADGVLDVVRDHRGYVVSSHVSGGDPGVKGAERGHASFSLMIPAGELSGAMGDLSDLGHVVSRSDGAHDITKRFVSARKRIDALTAERDSLLRQLGEATTIAEQQSIRARLRIVETRLSAAHRDLDQARQRVQMVPVTVGITADGKPASGGAWTLGDAFHDAGRVLTVAAGAALVGGAALLPFALLAVLGVAGWRGWVRRQRSRALDAPAS